MKKLIFFFLTISFFCTLNLFSEELEPNSYILEDEEVYFVLPEERYTFKPFVSTRKNTISLYPEKNQDKYFATKPLSTLGANLYFGNFGAGIGVGIDNGLYTEEKYGETKMSDLSLGFYSSSLIISINYIYYEGYYATDSGKVFGQAKSLGALEDMKSSNLNLSALYIFNPRFSYSAAFNQHRILKKSAASLILEGFVSQDKIQNEGTLSLLNCALSAGAAGIAVNDGLFAAGYLLLGTAFQSQKIDDFPGEKDKKFAAFSLKSRFSAGYNSDSFFGGVAGSTTNLFSFLENSKLIISDYLFEIFAGLRF